MTATVKWGVVLLCVAACSSSVPTNQVAGKDPAGKDPDAGKDPPDSGSSTADSAAPSGPAPSLTTIAMPLINRKVPAFASIQGYPPPSSSNDGNPVESWGVKPAPVWIAYDVSAAPAEQRQQVMLAWNCEHVAGYITTTPDGDRPVDYTIEINAAPGGGNPPTSGWTQVASVTGAERSSMEHVFALAGGNWVRMNISKSADPDGTLALEVDIYSAPSGASNSWLFMGDSITHITFPYPWCDVPSLVNKIKSDRWPQTIEAGIGGTGAGTAVSVIDDTMAGFPGRFVTLNYGTNDHSDEFPGNMEILVQKVIAAGKIPVIPHVPWSDGGNSDGSDPDKLTKMNAAIDALYVKYPVILKGPDLYGLLLNHPEWIPKGDVHPNGDGQEVMRQAWATVIAAVP